MSLTESQITEIGDYLADEHELDDQNSMLDFGLVEDFPYGVRVSVSAWRYDDALDLLQIRPDTVSPPLRRLTEELLFDLWILNPAASAIMVDEFNATPTHGRIYEDERLWAEVKESERAGLKRCLGWISQEFDDLFTEPRV